MFNAYRLGTNAVTIPRHKALELARYERDSLWARERGSELCSVQWRMAATQAQYVVTLLEAGRDRAAADAALQVGPLWKHAAQCEGFQTPVGRPSKYRLGAEVSPKEKLVLPPQLPSEESPFKTLKIPTLLMDKEHNFVDFFLIAKLRAQKAYGVYPSVRTKTGSLVPLTTPAMVIKTTEFLLKENARQQRSWALSQEQTQIKTVRRIQKVVLDSFNEQMKKTGIPIGSSQYAHLLSTTLIHPALAKDFWDNFRAFALRLNAVKGKKAYAGFALLAESFWERTKEVAKKIKKGAEKGLKGLWEFLKNFKIILIVIAVLIGGFLTWKILEVAKA